MFHSLALLVVLLLASSHVQAQSTCDKPTIISAPFSSTTTSLAFENADSSDMCGSAPTNGSKSFKTGLWFSYTPSTTKISRIHLEIGNNDPYRIQAIVSTGTCGVSLTCLAASYDAGRQELVFEGQGGIEHFIFIFVRYTAMSAPFTFSLSEPAPPANDRMEDAIALTSQDLPLQENYNLAYALSDFKQDACALSATYGVWFTFQTSYAKENLVLRVKTGSPGRRVGIQVQNGNRFQCVTYGYGTRQEVEWTAEGGKTYYILVTDHVNYVNYDKKFEFVFQSLGTEDAPPGGTFSGICN